MPMPTEGAWPPPHVAPAYAAYQDWDAWYSGNPDKLRSVYAGRGSQDARVRPSQRVYPGQNAGGVVGRFSRWLWGAPPPINQRDGRLHIPLAADLATVAASLLFSEPPKLSVKGDKEGKNKEAQGFLDRLIEDGLHTKLFHAAEANSVLGDIYLRPVIDLEAFSDRAIMTTVHADGAIPVIRWGKLIEVTFWQCLEDDGKNYLRLLEHHDVVNGAGWITYALFKGTVDQLGDRIKLTDHPLSAYLAKVVDAEGSQATKLKKLDVVRIPNDGPQRQWRTAPGLKYYGRSDFDGNEQVFDRIDEVWTSWMRDIHAAKARILVPDYMMQSQGAGQGATFDPEREIYQTLTMLPNQSGNNAGGITMTNFAIRWEEHKASADALVEVALRHAGFSSQTYGGEGDMAITATEAQNKDRQSTTTRGNRSQAWMPGVADYVELQMELERVNFPNRPEAIRPMVEFGDGFAEAPETIARTIQLLDAAAAISTETKVRMAHPDWEKDAIDAEVKAIKGEKAEAMALENPEDELGAPNGLPKGDNGPPGK